MRAGANLGTSRIAYSTSERKSKLKRAALFVAVLIGTALPAGSAWGATSGTWTAYPGQAPTYAVSVQQPINADGTSRFSGNGNAVIPVKFSLAQGVGPFAFESILSDATSTNDYSFLSFRPDPAKTFNDITVLKASYSFLQGNCGGGSLRWSVTVDVGNDGITSNDGSVFIYYGNLPNFTDCTTNSQSGTNMIGLGDLRYDTSQVGGTFYDSYANAQALVGSAKVRSAALVIDSGWFAGDQRLTLASATVNDNTFTPSPGSSPSATCDLPEAAIKVTKTAGATSGAVNEPVSIQPGDTNNTFRKVDCKYMYNLATSSLSGTGTYKVEAVIGGVMASGAATFQLR